jgi:hypothetical protein
VETRTENLRTTRSVSGGPAASALSRAEVVMRSLEPQAASVCGLRVADRLPRGRVSRGTVSLWWLGVHGGAGETTLAQLLEGSWETGHAWPQAGRQATELPRVVLVARTNARGLRAAQRAAIEWASGSVAVQLHGLVLVADAPGRLPKPLRDFAHVVAGGVPRVWRLPWVEAWRLGEPVCAETAPKAVTAVLDDLRDSYLPAPTSTPTP